MTLKVQLFSCVVTTRIFITFHGPYSETRQGRWIFNKEFWETVGKEMNEYFLYLEQMNQIYQESYHGL